MEKENSHKFANIIRTYYIWKGQWIYVQSLYVRTFHCVIFNIMSLSVKCGKIIVCITGGMGMLVMNSIALVLNTFVGIMPN